MPDNRLDEMIRRDWRELGFFYDLNDRERSLTLTGSRSGLLRFPETLRAYVRQAGSESEGEHTHLLPHFLKIMTSQEAALDRKGIRGSIADLERLAMLVEDSILTSTPGSMARIREEFSPQSAYSLVVDLREDGFDPASMENF